MELKPTAFITTRGHSKISIVIGI